MEAQRITVALVDRSAGYEATPQRVKLSTLVDFASDVQQLLRGEAREIDPAQLEVSVIEGSVAIQTSPIAAAPALFEDLKALLQTELLDTIDRKRREVLERWQKAARGTRGIAFRISAPFLVRPVVVSSESDYRADDADQWVQVERYVRGEIQDLGGMTKANAHVRLPDGTSLKVSTERDLLRNEKINRLYKTAMLRIRAQYNVLTRELRDARLVEFVEYAPSIDEEELARLTKRGAQAWKDIPDATSWVDEMRGGAD
jgi:hypothetical protein